MRFVLAIVSFVLAAAMIGTGIAQRTIFLEPDRVVLTASVDGDAPVTVIEGSALNAYQGNQTLTVSGADTVTAAYGRTTDVIAWVGDANHNVVSLDTETGELVTELVRGTETEVPTPVGSDLWLQEYTRDTSLTATVSVPADYSFLVVSDGVAAAPGDLRVSWPVDNSTPWAGPLIIAGAAILLLGLAFLLWAIHHMRSARGPRRKPQKMPKVPRKRLPKPRAKSALESKSASRRSLGSSMVAAPILLVGALVLSGCTAGLSTEVAPTPSASAVAPDGTELPPPAATVTQVERIVDSVRTTAATADAAKDSTAIATRFGGAALELRLASYAIQNGDPAQTGLPAIPEGDVSPILPQQTDIWPRAVLAVVQNPDDTTIAPVALFLEQATPRENYKVMYAITLEPAAVFPPLAPADIGAARLAADSVVLQKSPTEVALAYADILTRDVDSDSYLDFQAEGDSLRVAVGLAAKNQIRASLPTTASVEFSQAIGTADAITLSTNDNGALIAVNLNETTTVKPIEAGAAVNPSGQVKALSGVAVSTKGVTATYGDQLLFYVPPAGGDGKIVLLGYSQGLIKASELP